MEPTSTGHEVEPKVPSPKRSFLRQGQGITRFGLKKARVKFKNRPQQQQQYQPSPLLPHLQSSSLGAGGSGLKSASSPLLLHCHSHSKQWGWGGVSPAGILAGEDDTREVRK